MLQPRGVQPRFIDKGLPACQTSIMLTEVQRLQETLDGFGPLSPENTALAANILAQVERYFRTTFAEKAHEKRGTALSQPVDAALKTAILMLEGIDTGTSGLDDQLAKSLHEVYEKYLGTFKI